MANESGTAALTGWLNTSIISSLVTAYALDAFPAQKLIRQEGIAPGTKTAAFSKPTKQAALSGTITELTGLSNTVYQSSNVTAAVAEVGILRQFTKLGERTNMKGPQGLLQEAFADGVNMCLEKFETDIWALWTGFSTSVGTSGAAYTSSNFAAALAQHTINKSGGGPIVSCLTTTQVKNLRADLQSSGAAHLADGMGNDVLKQADRDGYVGQYMGCPIYTNTLGTVSGPDTVGAHFIDGVADPEHCPVAFAIGWYPEPAILQNPVFSGGTQMAVTMAYGGVEVQDAFGVKDVTIT